MVPLFSLPYFVAKQVRNPTRSQAWTLGAAQDCYDLTPGVVVYSCSSLRCWPRREVQDVHSVGLWKLLNVLVGCQNEFALPENASFFLDFSHSCLQRVANQGDRYAQSFSTVVEHVACVSYVQVNRVFYKVALVPLGDYVFFLAQFTTFGVLGIKFLPIQD